MQDIVVRPLCQAMLLLVAGLAAAGAVSVHVAVAQQPEDVTQAPLTTLSADGRSSTDGTRTLTVSRASGIDPNGEVVTVTGSGYNVEKGIYVAFCVLPASRSEVPTPCGGGIDLSGETGASRWISSNPPSYGVGLADPYGPGGSFEVTLAIGPEINDELDCREVRCGIVTRSDHTRTSDRSQDIIVPVSFLQPGETPQAAAPETADTPIPTATPEPTAVPDLPETVLSDGGRTATRGERAVSVSRVDSLDPAGERVTVEGAGFDEADGVYIALCRVPREGEAPEPCSAGPDVSAWVSSQPPDYARDLAQPYEPGGTFTLDLTLQPVLDAATDCRTTACGIVVRPDDVSQRHPLDYVLLPVRFGAEASIESATASPPASSGPAEDADDDRGSGAIILVAAAIALVAGGSLYGFYRTRMAKGRTP